MNNNKLWNILKEMGIPDNVTSLQRNLYSGQGQLDLENQTGSKLGKGYLKGVFCHPASLTYIQGTS